MVIDCNDCTMQHTAQCQDCVVTYIMRGPGEPVVVDGREAAALDELGRAGLVPLLRLVPRPPHTDPEPDEAPPPAAEAG